MGAKPLEIHPAALSDSKSALAWYLDRSETAAAKFVDEVDRAVGLVIASPERWPAGEHDTRKFVLSRFPFAIVYRENNPRSRYWPLPTGTGTLGIGKSGCKAG